MGLFLLVLGCGGREPAPVSAADTGTVDCTETDWWSAGQPLMLSYCASCHSSHLTGEQRYGAPSGVDLETLDGALTYTDRIYNRAINLGDMPPGGGMSAEELARLEVWLRCSSDDTPSPLPTSTMDFEVYSNALTVEVEDDSDGWRWLLRVDDLGAPFLDERYLIIDDDAWLSGYILYEALSFSAERAVFFDPPIPLTSPEGESSWEVEVEAEIDTNGTTTTTAQTWRVTSGEATQVDGRSTDRSPTEVVMVEDGGETHIWHLSQTRILSGRWIEDGENVLSMQRFDPYSSGVVLTEDAGFPFEVGDTWTEKGMSELGGAR